MPTMRERTPKATKNRTAQKTDAPRYEMLRDALQERRIQREIEWDRSRKCLHDNVKKVKTTEKSFMIYLATSPPRSSRLAYSASQHSSSLPAVSHSVSPTVPSCHPLSQLNCPLSQPTIRASPSLQQKEWTRTHCQLTSSFARVVKSSGEKKCGNVNESIDDQEEKRCRR